MSNVSPDINGILVMVEYRSWGTVGLLLPSLQEKLNTYLTYVTSGQLYVSYPELKGKKVYFELRTIHPLSKKEMDFLEIVNRMHLEPAGIGFNWRIISNNDLHA